jgi:hypothetical protein
MQLWITKSKCRARQPWCLLFSIAVPGLLPTNFPLLAGMLAGSATSARRLAHLSICAANSERFCAETGSPSLMACRSSAGLLGMVQEMGRRTALVICSVVKPSLAERRLRMIRSLVEAASSRLRWSICREVFRRAVTSGVQTKWYRL